VVDVHGGLVRVGRMAGLNADQVDKCIDNKTEDDRINKQTADAESRYNVNSTPTFFLDGVNLGSGNLPIADMSKTIDAALAAKK
jgi:protein-disulfide isomerase